MFYKYHSLNKPLRTLRRAKKKCIFSLQDNFIALTGNSVSIYTFQQLSPNIRYLCKIRQYNLFNSGKFTVVQ
jgi:hypothetical protein